MTADWRVNVTDHALARYRERIAEYADAKAGDVLKALGETVPGHHPTVCPSPGFVYRTHPATGAMFVLKPEGIGLATLVTVRRPDEENRNFLTPKPKSAPAMPTTPAKAKAKAPGFGSTADWKVPVEVWRLIAEPDPDPALDPEARRLAWNVRKSKLEACVAGLKNKSPVRMAVRPAISAAHAALAALKADGTVKESRRQKHQALMAEIEANRAVGILYRSDGALDFQVAVPFLLKRVEELEARLAALEAGHAPGP